MSSEHEGYDLPAVRLCHVALWLVACGLVLLAALLLAGCRTQTHVRQQCLFGVTIVNARDYDAAKRVDPATDLSLPLP